MVQSESTEKPIQVDEQQPVQSEHETISHESLDTSLQAVIELSSDINDESIGPIDLFLAPNLQDHEREVTEPIQALQVIRDEQGRAVIGIPVEQVYEPELGSAEPAPITTLDQLSQLLDILDQLSTGLDDKQEASQPITLLDNSPDVVVAPGLKHSIDTTTSLIEFLIQQLDLQEGEDMPPIVLLVTEDILEFIEQAKSLAELVEDDEISPKRFVTLSTGDREMTIDIQTLRKLIQLHNRTRRSRESTPIPIEVEDMTAWEEKGWQTISYQYWDEDVALGWVRLMALHYVLSTSSSQATLFF